MALETTLGYGLFAFIVLVDVVAVVMLALHVSGRKKMRKWPPYPAAFVTTIGLMSGFVALVYVLGWVTQLVLSSLPM